MAKRVRKPKESTEVTEVKKAAEEVVKPQLDLESFGFKIPKSVDAIKKQVMVLAEQRDAGQKHLGVLLSHLRMNDVHLAHGQKDFFVFCEQELMVNPGSARNAMKILESYSEMGCPPELFPKVSQTHIAVLKKGFDAGALSQKEVMKLLPQTIPTDKDYKLRAEFQKFVEKKIGKEAGDSDKVSKSFAIKCDSGAQQEVIQSCLQTLAQHPELGKFTQSQLLGRALTEFTANHAKDATSFISIRAMVNMLAGFLPQGMSVILVKTGELDMTEEAHKTVAGLLIDTAYVARDTGAALAADVKGAAKAMKVAQKEVEPMSLFFDPSILPTVVRPEKTEEEKPAEAEEAEEEGEVEEAEQEEEPGKDDLADIVEDENLDELKAKVRTLLADMDKRGIVTKHDLLEKTNELKAKNPAMTQKERFEAILTWLEGLEKK